MNTRELLETYYRGFARKSGWEEVISDDFKFIGGDMKNPVPVEGREAYIRIIKRFCGLFTSMRVREMFTTDDRAFVLANYDYEFPNGKTINGDVTEYWKINNGKLSGLTIYFDTLTFHEFTGK